jgi:hypothetical protein
MNQMHYLLAVLRGQIVGCNKCDEIDNSQLSPSCEDCGNVEIFNEDIIFDGKGKFVRDNCLLCEDCFHNVLGKHYRREREDEYFDGLIPDIIPWKP